MKTYSPEALAALEAGTAIVSGAVEIDLVPPFRVWGGHGPLTIDGVVFQGVGDRGIASTSGGSLGTAEQGVELSLSGVDPDVLALVDYASVRGAAVVLWELVFDGSGANLLAAQVDHRGRIDRMPREDIPGGASLLKVLIEGAVRGLGRRGARMRTDADQRLYLGTDGGFSRVAYAGQKQLQLGGAKPAPARVVVGGREPGVGGNKRPLDDRY